MLRRKPEVGMSLAKVGGASPSRHVSLEFPKKATLLQEFQGDRRAFEILLIPIIRSNAELACT